MLSDNGKINPESIRSALPTKSLFATSSDESDREVVDNIVSRALSSYPNEELWGLIEKFDHNSSLALEALSERATESDLAKIRTGLEMGFEPKRPQPSKSWALGDLLGNLSNVTFEPALRTSALEVLVSHASPSDRDLFLRILLKPSIPSEEQWLCLLGLSQVGLPQDAHIAERFIKDPDGHDSPAAIRAFLRNGW